MGRTIPSFRIALEMEKEDWKPFRNALDNSDTKKFLMRCLISIGFTPQLAHMLFSLKDFIPF
jgi:hypothetical protein